MKQNAQKWIEMSYLQSSLKVTACHSKVESFLYQ